MKILYLTQTKIDEKTHSGIYYDLLSELVKQGCEVCVVSGDYDEYGCTHNNGIKIVKVKTAKQFGVSIFKKGLAFLSMTGKFKKAIRKNLKKDLFDLILYEAPPVMMCEIVKYCKKKFTCKTYLMQKDIFPQNAIDIGILSKNGLKGLVYKYFLKKERKLYNVSDKIGCMSIGNIEYLRKHNKEIANKCELFPNSAVIADVEIDENEKIEIASKYSVNLKKVNFVYGGNLGKPQGIDELLKNIEKCQDISDAHFYIIGKGTEAAKVKQHCLSKINTTFFDYIPSKEYQKLMQLFDVGIIALDYRFTIPNYPSRVLTYLGAEKAIIASTDSVTDFRQLIETDAKCGLWNESRDSESFYNNVKSLVDEPKFRNELAKNGKQFMSENFKVIDCANKIVNFAKGGYSNNV